MAFEPGGYANKLGNRYEGRWVVKQLLRLLNEEIQSVKIEAIGDDEYGVDLLITRNNGKTQFQQCKARNGSKKSWSVADLNIRGILSHMKSQLDRNQDYEFALVSGIQGTAFTDVCESARNSDGDSENFYQHQIQNTGEGRRRIYRKFCEYLNLNPQQQPDRQTAFDYLRRMRIIQWQDDQNGRDDMHGWARMLVTGNPEVVVANLTDFAQNNLRKTLHADTIQDYLAGIGFHSRRLPHDNRVVPAIEELKQRFEESISYGLIAGELIKRDETQQLLNALEENSVVIIHGSAGYGKSGVLYELTRILQKQEWSYLPVRLDRQIPKNTTQQFGEDLGLPESPVMCLESLLGEKSGVLILDQLDALRWTSSHSANSLDVCKSIVRETQNLRSMGKPISVILSCRTFDLEHDPEIKTWIEKQQSPNKKSLKIAIRGLSEKAIQTVVQKIGGDFNNLTARQKQILASPQHLSMWVKLKQDNNLSEFQSATQLMRDFWIDRYQELETSGITTTEADAMLDILVDYMEQNGKISAPTSLISSHQKTHTVLQTSGIIQTDGCQTSFSHQSYLDFYIADRLLKSINQKQGDILTWLGPKEAQTLFRREQLRQVLLLLADENSTKFLKGVKELLSNDKVRFHLKHLALSILGQIEQPTQPVLDFAIELLNDSHWKDHALELIYLRNAPYIHSLATQGIIQNWLGSSNKSDINSALWLLRSINETSGDLIVDLLTPYIDKEDDWPQRILRVLWFSPEKDSDKAFELRIKLAQRGHVSDYIHWETLAQENPLRVIFLIEAAISTWDSPKLEDNSITKKRRSRFESWGLKELKVLKEAACKNPLSTWDLLLPHVERLTAIEIEEHDTRLNDWHDWGRHSVHEGYTDLPRGIVLLICEAGKEFAKNQTKEFLTRIHNISDSSSIITQEILVTTYASLPPKFSDIGIQWLLNDSHRLAIGSGYNEPKWMPAARLIEALSPHCSEGLFRQLEDVIIHYHSPNEKQMAEYYVSTWKKGYFGDYWGRAQYFLLPALCEKRRGKNTKDLIRVLGRKFDGYPKHRFLSHGHSTGGWVGSPLQTDISDKAWLGIINNKNILEEDHRRFKQIGPDRAAESSIIHFANSLSNIASRHPERFAQLALQFPEDVHPRYLAAVLDGVKTTEPKDISDEEKTSWEPAKIETVEAILEKFHLGDDHSTAINFCWLIRERADENWSDKAINRLLDYAKSHSDPKSGKLNMYPTSEGDDVSKASVHTLLDNALNCVRGIAGLAIGALLWEHPDWLDRLRPGIIALVKDPHPAVQVAAIEACLPVININKDLAVELFVTACQDDIRVAASRFAVYYFNSCLQSHFKKLAPIILRMLDSQYDEVAEEGTTEICARWLFHRNFEDELETCKTGTVAQRKGIAKILSSFLCNKQYMSQCRELLPAFLNDEDPEVRRKARNVFHNNKELLKILGMIDFVKVYIQTQSFRDDPTGLLYTLKDFPGSLIPYSDIIFDTCDVFVGPLAELSRDPSTGMAHDALMICPLILRLYEQSQDDSPEIKNRCLDAWDTMFEHRLGIVLDLMKEIDSQM